MAVEFASRPTTVRCNQCDGFGMISRGGLSAKCNKCGGMGTVEIMECVNDARLSKNDAWDVAQQENFDRDHSYAIIENAAFTRRMQEVGIDKLLIRTVADNFDEWVSSRVTPAFQTQETMSVYHDLITLFKSAIHCFEQAGQDLT